MITYNIPSRLTDSYRENRVIVRSDSPRELARCAEQISKDNLEGLELSSLSSDPEPLLYLQEPVPIDLAPSEEWNDHAELVKFVALQRDHYVQVFMHPSQGFVEVAKKVSLLGFPIRLQISSPVQLPVTDLLDLLWFYLHDEKVKEPIEFFHSMARILYDRLLDPYNTSDETMWHIMEEHPAIFRYVTDEGKVVLSRRLKGTDASEPMDDFFDNLELELLTQRGECSTCPFFPVCAGYFKVPDRTFKCKDVVRIFERLQEEMTLLRVDLEERKTIPEGRVERSK